MKKYVELSYKDLTLRGFIETQNNSKIIVMLHGYTGNKTESKQFFKNMSENFMKEGYDTLRMDFSGHGESDGQFRDIDISDLTKQANVFVDYAEELNYNEIFLIGFSMGGLISFNLLDRKISKAALISPAVDFTVNIENMFKRKIVEKNVIDIGGLELSSKFLNSLKMNDPLIHSKKSSIPIFITIGNKDSSVNFSNVISFAKEFNNTTVKVIENCDHVYSNVEHRELVYKSILSHFSS